MFRPVRRRLKRTVQRSPDNDHARQALAVLQLWETGDDVTEVARRLCAARSSVYRWRGQFEEYGEGGIAPQGRGRTDWKASDELLEVLEALVRMSPQELGYLRTRWSSELLAVELEKRKDIEVHASTVRRWLRNNPKFRLLFQPVYHPWVNRIDRLWKALHGTVTRNHRHRTMDELMAAVRRFLVVCQPFPGNHRALAMAHV